MTSRDEIMQKRASDALAPLAALRESWAMRAGATRPIDRAIQRLNDAFADVMLARQSVAEELYDDGDISAKEREDMYSVVRRCVAKTIAGNLSQGGIDALVAEIAGPMRLLTITVSIDGRSDWTPSQARRADDLC